MARRVRARGGARGVAVVRVVCSAVECASRLSVREFTALPPFPPCRAVQRSLPPDREVLAVMEAWFEKPLAKFVFQLKLYTETMVTSKDPKVVNMMFIQVRSERGRGGAACLPI